MGTFFPLHYITYGNRHALVRPDKNGSIMKSMAMVNFFIVNKDTLWSVFAKMVDNEIHGYGRLFIENKGTIFPHPDITYGNRHSLVCICKNRSMMKSMAMVDFFVENKGTFFPYHYITYENRHALVPVICKNGWLMKSMAMVDFFIENKGKGVNFCVNGNFLPISLHYLWKQTRFGPHALVRICENGSIRKSLAMVDIFIKNKGTFFPYHYITYGNRHALVRIYKNGSLMKFMTMVDFFIENKGHSLVRDSKNRSMMKSMAMVDFFVENKGTFFPYHYITYGNRLRFGPDSKNGSIMKSMAMVDFFIENKGTFFPYHYITYENRHALVQICKNGWLMKSMAMVDFFIENKGKGVNFLCKWELSSHIITLPMETDTLWSRYAKNGSIMKSLAMVDIFIKNKGTFFPYHYITYGNRHALVQIHKNGSINEIHDYGRLLH
ncbi:hypothetical protein H6P81_021603 [Aristolochia fimbriata]|uniref:Uncharacterized protein n=1 Tax=Aristolochia fimbriata TaxID=158543 RepID=A0AAV7DQF7_ARIFI|nr:hypothetical protein H6P81_021603 [Aristolochia fimbriata]